MTQSGRLIEFGQPSQPQTTAPYSRFDEQDDASFYATERPGPHLDAKALATVERLIGTLVTGDHPRILDLMAATDSHLPAHLEPASVVGLGMNAQELAKNPRLTQAVVHDLNRDPRLPFGNAAFDAVLCTVSVGYLVRPVEVFTEVARVLAPGGLFLVVFSNRMFKTKAVKSWRDASDPERKLLLEDYFCAVDTFEPSASFVSQGRVRPPNDRYAGLGIPSDPVWAVYAETHGGDPDRIRRSPVAAESDYDPEAVARRKQAVKHTLRCPYCDAKLDRFDLPLSPFCEWPNEYMYVCFNNDCPYLVEGWQVMNEQGNPGISYRLMYNPDQDRCLPVAEASVRALGQYVVAPRG